jgi:SCY1-like protein 1
MTTGLMKYVNTATSDYYDAQECATKIVPAISLVLIDKEK